MKRILIILLAVSAFALQASADNDFPITFEELPAKSRTFVNENFKDVKVSFVKKEKDFLTVKYEVLLSDGTDLQFDSSGEWKEIECKYSSVPEKFVPSGIRDYVNANYPGVKYLKIERSSREYEVDLSNGYELTFDMSFRLTDVDR